MLYIDNLKFNGMKYYDGVGKQLVKTAHLFADSLQELLNAGDLLGLKPNWIHYSNNKIPHFDIMTSKFKLLLKQKEFLVTQLDKNNYNKVMSKLGKIFLS